MGFNKAHFKNKLELLYKPFLVVLLGLVIGYTFLNWVIFIQLGAFQFKKIIIEFVIPIILCAIAAWFYLGKRLKMLKIDFGNGNLRDFYKFILWIIFIIPLIIAQKYIVSASGEMTKIGSIAQIENVEQTKYYTVQNYYINRKLIGAHSEFNVSGRHNNHFNMRIYVAAPIFERKNDSKRKKPSAWIGIEYHKEISNNLSKEKKDSKYKLFAKDCQRDLNNKDFTKINYFDRIENSKERDGIIEAINKNSNYSSNDIILVGIDKPFEERNGNKLAWIFGSTIIGAVLWFFMICIPKVDERHLKRIKAGKPDKEYREELQDVTAFITPRKNYFITPVLIYINTGIFLIMTISGLGFLSFKASDLMTWGANHGPSIDEGEYWRLFTSIFLHGGIMHLAANVFGLLLIGTLLEPLLDRKIFLSLYILMGIAASLTSVWWHAATVSVGASGAIFGLYGILIAFLLTKVYSEKLSKALLGTMLLFIGFNLLMGLKGGIDNAAHIGGLLSGFLLGVIVSFTIKR